MLESRYCRVYSILGQVPHFLEKEKMTFVDLLSSIGGIIGVCLGASLLTLFNIIERGYANMHHKIRKRRIEAIGNP